MYAAPAESLTTADGIRLFARDGGRTLHEELSAKRYFGGLVASALGSPAITRLDLLQPLGRCQQQGDHRYHSRHIYYYLAAECY